MGSCLANEIVTLPANLSIVCFRTETHIVSWCEPRGVVVPESVRRWVTRAVALQAFVDLVLEDYAEGKLLHVVPWASGSNMTREVMTDLMSWGAANHGMSFPFYCMVPVCQTTLVWFKGGFLPFRVERWRLDRAFSTLKLAFFVSRRQRQQTAWAMRVWEEVSCRPGARAWRKAALSFAAQARPTAPRRPGLVTRRRGRSWGSSIAHRCLRQSRGQRRRRLPRRPSSTPCPS